jgi:hypothetical protein
MSQQSDMSDRVYHRLAQSEVSAAEVDIRDGHFSPWRLEPWESHDKIARKLLALETFLDDKTQSVFRKRKT